MHVRNYRGVRECRPRMRGEGRGGGREISSYRSEWIIHRVISMALMQTDCIERRINWLLGGTCARRRRGRRANCSFACCVFAGARARKGDEGPGARGIHSHAVINIKSQIITIDRALALSLARPFVRFRIVRAREREKEEKFGRARDPACFSTRHLRSIPHPPPLPAPYNDDTRTVL